MFFENMGMKWYRLALLGISGT